MIFGEKYSDSTILYLMFSAGYLTIDIVEEEDYLRISNLEIRKYFRKTFISTLTPKSKDSFSKLKMALVIGKVLKLYVK